MWLRMQQHMQMQQMQMQPEMQTQMQTGTLTTTPFGNPVDYPVDAQGMQLDDPEVPPDFDEFIDKLMQELPDERVLELCNFGFPDN